MLTAIYILAGVGAILFSAVIVGLSTLGAMVLYRMFTMWRLSRASRPGPHGEKNDAESNSDVSTP